MTFIEQGWIVWFVLQFVGLVAITLGFAKVLFDDRRLQVSGFSLFRFSSQTLPVVIGLGIAFSCSILSGFDSPLELTVQSVAIIPFSLVGFWSVTHRGSVEMRMAVFLALLVMLVLLLAEPIDRYSGGQSGGCGLGFSGHALSRLVVGIVAGMFAGVYCRLLGWTIQIRDAENQQPDASTRDIWILILGIVISVPLLLLLQAFTQHWYSGLFDTNFALVRMACFYAACILAFLSIMICRFTNQWLVAACVIVFGLSIQIVFREGLYRNLGFLELGNSDAYNWYQFTPWFIIVWWLVSWLLRHLGVDLQKTNELLLFQLQLKHFVVATGIACLLVANVKSQYVNQFAKKVQEDLRQVGGDATLRGNDIVSLTIARNGVPELLLKSLPRLQHLEAVSINASLLNQELLDLLTRCPKLKTLEIQGCSDSLTTPVSLSGFKHLERLEVTDTSIAATQFEQLVSESPISYLQISDPRLIMKMPTKFLQHLDLSRVQQLFKYDDLLKVDAVELCTITPPMYSSASLLGFASVPLNLPSLQELQLACGELTPKIVADLNELNLTRLNLQGCQSGFERIKDLNVNSIGVNTQFDEQTLSTLIDEPKVIHLNGSAKKSVIRASATGLFGAYQDRRLTCDLASSENTSSIPDELKALMGFGRGRVALQTHGIRRVLQIREDGGVLVCGMPLSLDEFLQVLTFGQDIQVQSRVYDGDPMMLNNFYASKRGNPLTQLFELRDSSWTKLSAVLDQDTSLYLVRPRLSTDCWRRLAEWPSTLQIEWDELPKDYQRILSVLSDRNVRISVRKSLSDEQTAELQKYPKINVSHNFMRFGSD